MKDRVCSSCQQKLPRKSFTKNQLSKGLKKSRCTICVRSQPAFRVKKRKSLAGDKSKKSDAPLADFTDDDLNHPFAEGSFLRVAIGQSAWGRPAGVVCKWLKPGVVFNQREFFEANVKAARKAREIIDRFNNLQLVSRSIRINIPEVREFEHYPDDEEWILGGILHLQQPFIRSFEKFNSNTGWVGTTDTAQTMQGLSHFSYHVTSGECVLCDLQGGGDNDRKILLTDPVILSHNREYGFTDFGVDGIQNFFSHHQCSKYCHPTWTLPENPVRLFSPHQGTMMLRPSTTVDMA
jgi:hypothetical protein